MAAAVAGCGSSDAPAAHRRDAVRTITTTAAPVVTTVPTTTTTVPTTTTAPVPAPVAHTAAPACATSLASSLSSTGNATQLLTVEASGYGTTYATLTAWARQGPCWVAVLGPWTARLGASGFSDHKTEGDNATPTGSYGLGAVVYGNAADPGVRYSYHQLVCGDWWDEDPSSPQYNQFVHVSCGQNPPFGGDSEALWQETQAYPAFAVIDYNTAPVEPGAGSAIFLHADVGGPTAGCVSIPLSDLDAVLRWLDPAQDPLVVMGPSSEIARF